MLLEKEDNEDVLAFLEQNRERAQTEELLEVLQQRSLSTAYASSTQSTDSIPFVSDDEEDIGLKYPRAFELSQTDFATGLDYVKSFVKETKMLHRGDVHNEERKS